MSRCADPAHTAGRNGRGDCIDCQRAAYARWRAAHPERARAMGRAKSARWAARHPDYALTRRRSPHEREQYPARVKARAAVRDAIRTGELQREPCLFCEAPDVHGHHHDYSQPLAVTWLCQRHHALVHRAERARAEREAVAA